MRKFFHLIGIILLMGFPIVGQSQQSSFELAAKKELGSFSIRGNSFTGKGWDSLLTKIRKSDFVLIGEDHFTNEIPFFFSAILRDVHFDNFFAEIDPYSAKIITSKIRDLSASGLKKYVQDWGNVFSFFALEPEFRVLHQLVAAKTNVSGLDQILLVADRLLCNDLKLKTKNSAAKIIYTRIEQQSEQYFANFLRDPNKPFYMLTEGFDKNIQDLRKLPLSLEEKEIVEALALTASIYKEQNHHLRIQLMKQQLMKDYSSWESKKNLFKFGAFHLPKGESLMKIYDIGNLVHNIADSKFKNSLHIMIVGQSGMQGSPFKGFPPQPIDPNGEGLKALKPFFDMIETDQWHCFDMLALRTALEEGSVTINDIDLIRIIKGYDYVIVIPRVTAAAFPDGR